MVWTLGFRSTLPSSRARVQEESVSSPLSPLGERVARTGVFFSRGGPGEGVPIREWDGCHATTTMPA